MFLQIHTSLIRLQSQQGPQLEKVNHLLLCSSLWKEVRTDSMLGLTSGLYLAISGSCVQPPYYIPSESILAVNSNVI